MNKYEFLKELERHLRYLPREDRDDAMAYYIEYLDEAGFSDTDDVTVKLGTPKDVARTIMKDCGEKAAFEQQERKSVKGSGKVIWMALLGVASLPISLPIAIIAVLLVLALILTFLGLLIALAATSIGLIAGGAFAFAGLFFSPEIGSKLMSAGGGLIVMGFGLLLMFGTIEFFKFVVKLIGKSFSRKRGEL